VHRTGMGAQAPRVVVAAPVVLAIGVGEGKKPPLPPPRPRPAATSPGPPLQGPAAGTRTLWERRGTSTTTACSRWKQQDRKHGCEAHGVDPFAPFVFIKDREAQQDTRLSFARSLEK